MIPPETLERIAHAMDSGAIATGDLVALRRHPTGSAPLAFWRVLSGWVEDPGEHERVTAWRTALFVLASLSERHEPQRRLGAVLAEEGLSELRFERLLRSEGDALAASMRAVVHLLRSRRAAVDALALARLALVPPDAPTGEDLRRSIARQYFSALHHAQQES